MRWGILGFLFIAMIINFADKSVVGFASVPIMKEFNLSYTQWGLVGSSFFWLFSIAGVLGAAWSDKIGTKKMLSILVIAWTFLQFGALAVYSLPLFILTRVLLGAFEGPFYATAISQLSKWFPPQSRSLPISIMNFGGSIGALVSAPILVFLIQRYDWRTAFSVLGVIGLVWVLLWLWLAKESPLEQPIEAVTKSRTPKPTTQKIKWSELFPVLLSPTFIVATIAAFSGYWILSWITIWMPIYMVKVVHLTPIQMGLVASMVGIIGGVLQILICWFSDRLFKKYKIYRKSHVIVGASCFVLSALFLYSLTFIHSPAWAIIALCLLKALPYTMNVFAPQIAISLMPERGGLMSGLLWGIATVAGIIGPIVTGYLVELAGENEALGFNYGVQFGATLLLVSGILFFIFVKRDERIRIPTNATNQEQMG
ncbi:Sugar phosphate permease [Peribacillus simplex]|uniref:Sugar phosphate permease n=1 Tax=Peribacillus simplex TaxID=1478 RepID=A0A9X8RDK5_9BACI|nr:MFS transporter [Peribacillus simplex]SIS01551.1 Sugar phosphate permease [Peribacillus simplex]